MKCFLILSNIGIVGFIFLVVKIYKKIAKIVCEARSAERAKHHVFIDVKRALNGSV